MGKGQSGRGGAIWVAVGAMLAAVLAGSVPASRKAPLQVPAPASDQVASAVRAGLGRMPVSFVANEGRWDARASWVVPGAEATAYFLDGSLRWALTGNKGGWALDQVLVGARSAPPTASVPAAGRVSYFGTETHVGLPTASELTLAQAWPGVDVAWSGTGGRIEATYRLAPGADPGQVRVAWRGAESVAVTDDGRLAVTTPLRTFEEDAPRAFQDINGRRVDVEVTYALDGQGAYGFRLGPYDTAQPLVIDPAVLVYAGFLGGAGNDVGFGIAVDAAGSAYVTGQAGSREDTFPETTGAFQRLYGDGLSDAFVAKVNATGSTLVYASFLGGTGADTGLDIAVDGAGNAYVTGQTASLAPSFPVTAGAFGPQNAGGSSDAFVAKVSPDGSTLVYSSFLGGAALDIGTGIAVDGAGNAYVTGQTASTAATFPVTVGGFGAQNAGGASDAFVAKVSPDGHTLVYAGFLGGSALDSGTAIAVDGAGNAYISGTTQSAAPSFPVTSGVFGPQNAGGQDAFVAKVNADGLSLGYASFLGGSSSDSGNDIAVDGAGNAYVTGATASSAPSFPATSGVFQPQNAGGDDAFVAKVSPSGSTLVYAGFLGGHSTGTASGNDTGLGISVDAAGNAYVTGRTGSPAASFPETPGMFQAENAGGNSDAFVAKVNGTGSALIYAGFLGGSAQDSGNAIAVDGAGNAYITGEVQSLAATFPETPGALAAENSGLRDAFVAKVAGRPPVVTASRPAVARNVPLTTTMNWLLRDTLTTGNTTAFNFNYGTRPMVPVLGDWDGNGSKTPGSYEGGVFKLSNDQAGAGPIATVSYGSDPRGFPVVGDFDGDGVDDVAVYRNGLWQIRLSTGATSTVSGFGSGQWPGTVPVAGDWDGDGIDGIGYVVAGTWTLRNTTTSGAITPFTFTAAGTNPYPVVGDWDGNGTDTPGIKSGSGTDASWTLSNTVPAAAPLTTFSFGLANDFPLVWRLPPL